MVHGHAAEDVGLDHIRRLDADEEHRLRGEGVAPHYTLSQLAPEALRDGQRAPWYDDIASSSSSKLPAYRDGCPPLLIGGSAFGKGIFSDDETLQSTEPYRVVRLAFDYGVRAIDTSPFYHPSELTLGRILHALAEEHPRHTYYLQTKVGRYGPTREHFDYSPQRVRSSIKTSLERLGTTYLDSAVLHDVEFVCEAVGPSQSAGFAARDALSDAGVARKCGLAIGQDDADNDTDDLAAKIHGAGDEAVLAAMQALFALKDKGVVHNVGIGGYPLPTLLRLCRLIASTAPYRPVDVVVSYSHHTLQNDLLSRYRPLFAQEPASRRRQSESLPPWTPPMVINASPFSMGLLTGNDPPAWHPASEELKKACVDASAELRSAGKASSMASTAAHFGLRGSEHVIIGMNSVEQVHQAIQTYRNVLARTHTDDGERVVLKHFDDANVRDWTWASP